MASEAGGDAASPEDQSSSCIVCMEVMSERGPHRAVTLRCGHIFGQACIEKWLQERRKCPQCNKKSRPGDITVLYNLPKVGTVDTAAADEYERKLQQMEAQRKEIEAQKQQAERKLQQAQRDMQRMEQQLKRSRHSSSGSGSGAGAHAGAGQTRHGCVVANALAAAAEWAAGMQLAHVPGAHLPGAGLMVMPPAPHALPWGHASGAMMMMPGVGMGAAAASGATSYQLQPPPPPPRQQQQQQYVQVPQQQRQYQQGRHGQQHEQHTLPQQQRLRQQPSTIAIDLTRDDDAVIIVSSSLDRTAAAGAAAVQQYVLASAAAAPPTAAAAGQMPQQQNPHQPAAVPLARQPAQQVEAARARSGGATLPGLAPQQLHSTLHPPLGHSPAVAPALGAGLGRAAEAEEAMQPQQQPQQQQEGIQQLQPGVFKFVQSYSTCNSRCFDLHAPDALLIIPDVAPGNSASGSSGSSQAPGGAGSHLIKKISIICPQTPQCMQLKHNVGLVRQLAYSPQQRFVAAATNGGLHVMSTVTNNYVTHIDLQRPVWSCAWSRQCEQQVLCGLASGCLALLDLRMSGTASVVLVTGPAAPQPLHSVISLPQRPSPAGTPAAGCVVASTRGVLSWQQGQGQGQGAEFVAVTAPGPGLACESICWEEQEGLLGVSFRSALDGNGLGQHHVLSAAGAAAGSTEQRGAPWQLRSKLSGHRSKVVMTRGSFVRPYAGAPALFASADEQLCSPWLWDVQGSCLREQLTHRGVFQSPLLHLQGGSLSRLGGMLAASSKETLALYCWSPI